MKDDKLFRAMGDIDERYLDEAYTYGKNVKKFRKTHLTRWLAAAAVLTVVFSATAAAENLGWGAQIRSWLGIGDNQQVEGFTDYTSGQENGTVSDVQSENGKVTLLSSFVSGNRVIAYLSAEPIKSSQVAADEPWTAEFICDDPENTSEREFYESFLSAEATVKSQSEDEIVLQVTAVSEQLEPGQSLNITLIHGNRDTENPVVDEYETVAVPLTESPVLHTNQELTVHNDLADADGTVTDIAVSAGNIEVTVNHEYAEQWCSRVCVPDRGKTFMEQYTGKEWNPGTPEDGVYFTAEDERAIFAAYADTWDQTAKNLVGDMKVHMKDGSVIQLETPQEENYSGTASTKGNDAYVYRWEMNPVLELDQVESIEIAGTVYALS